ncbi:hypothetical protein ODZ84_13605 [Chryseobacterium fluminis]|uniref:hypothetical protein n=1 Tax=Chryseobacterium fluminis TaxID=2983606 RepID=UPI00224D92BE|nr:hypothetical protein [Chryseobacterium sp. MMS21-Ot14]UZT96260.1 hypothetical protein ODZ84_13605 [Chryseobacterium sp. MMS21-Ot14]
MIQFILMLFGLAFSHNNANTAACHNNQNPVTVQSGPSDPGGDTGTGGSEDGGPVGGNSGQLPPPYTPHP